MAAFVYKFNAVKKVKEQLKKKSEKELAEVELAIKEVQQKTDMLALELEELKKNFNEKRNMKISLIQFKKSSEHIIENKIELTKKEMQELLIKKQTVMSELEKKSKEHKIFDKLEDNMRAEFNIEQNKIDNGKIDEVAVQKFAGNNS